MVGIFQFITILRPGLRCTQHPNHQICRLFCQGEVGWQWSRFACLDGARHRCSFTLTWDICGSRKGSLNLPSPRFQFGSKGVFDSCNILYEDSKELFSLNPCMCMKRKYHLLAYCYNCCCYYFRTGWSVLRETTWHKLDPDSSVSIATNYWLDGWGLIPSTDKIFFSSPHCSDWFWGPPRLLCNRYQGQSW
jgi:hypothetical protein